MIHTSIHQQIRNHEYGSVFILKKVGNGEFVESAWFSGLLEASIGGLQEERWRNCFLEFVLVTSFDQKPIRPQTIPECL